MREEELKELKNLGNNTKYDYVYNVSVLEKIDNLYSNNDNMIAIDAHEFTTLCPKTGQPDYAKIYINYVPDKYLVESKSLKIYLSSFRNSPSFHEDAINLIMKDLVELLKPKYLEVLGMFNVRGGIAICPFASYAKEGCGYENIKKQRQFDVVNTMLKNKNAF